MISPNCHGSSGGDGGGGGAFERVRCDACKSTAGGSERGGTHEGATHVEIGI